jgi:diguanylate cyclase (GGDEF)-like protein
MQRFFERAHLLSTATFPLLSGERLLGTLNFSASTYHAFEPDEVRFLSLLCGQAVLAIEWLALHNELREANAALARAATHDPLTGLPNRVLFHSHLSQCLARAGRNGGMVAVLFIDLDDFKGVNDRFGHAAGDRLLRAVADRLQRTLRTGDAVARMGGDEFTVVLADAQSETAAAQVAERLRAAIAQPVELGGDVVVPGASIGIACGEGSRVSADDLLRQADLAMYRDKARTRQCAAGTEAGQRVA